MFTAVTMSGGSHSRSSTKNRHNEDKNNESVYITMEERVFSTLHPIVAKLLTSIQEFQAISTQYDNDGDEEVLLKKLKYQSDQVVTLRTEAQRLLQSCTNENTQTFTYTNGSDKMAEDEKQSDEEEDDDIMLDISQRREEHQRKVLNRAVFQMQQLIFLPLILILQRPVLHEHESEDGEKKKNENEQGAQRRIYESSKIRMKQIVKTAHCKCIENAALSLAFFVDAMMHTHGSNSDDLSIPVKLRMQIIYAVHIAIGHVRGIYESPSLSSSSGSTKGLTLDSLDKGGHCLQALLSCIESIATFKEHSNHSTCHSEGVRMEDKHNERQDGDVNCFDDVNGGGNDMQQETMCIDEDHITEVGEDEEEFITQLSHAMNGKFLPSVVMHSLSTLERDAPDPDTTNAANARDTTPTPTSTTPQDIKGNVPLKLQAMRVMEVLLHLGYPKKKNHRGSERLQRGIEKKEECVLTETWRSIFPGIFMTICRELLSQLRFSTSHSSSKLAVQAMKVLSLLLNRTLIVQDRSVASHEKEHEDYQTQSQSSTILSNATRELLVAAKATSTQSPSNSTSTTASKCTIFPSTPSSKSASLSPSLTPQEVHFFHHVRTKLPCVLQLIFQLAPVHKSKTVRHACITYLVTSILITTYTSWDMDLDLEARIKPELRGDNVGNKANDDIGVEEDENERLKRTVSDLRVAAMECIMALTKTDEESIVTVCRDTLLRYKGTVGEDAWNITTSEEIMPRIIQLMKRMPALARSGRESDLSLTMTLVSGYISMLHHSLTKDEGKEKERKAQQSSSDLFQAKRKKNRQSKRRDSTCSTYLSNKLTSDDIRQCLVDVFVMDNKSVQQGNILQYTSEGRGTKVDVDNNNHRPYLLSKFRYMREETARIGCGMIHDIATLIGFRRSVVLVDACVADIFESLSARINEGRSVIDGGHARWLEQYFGLTVVANEILTAFRGTKSAKRIKIVQSLTSSMISLICSDVLWQLPSTHAWAGATHTSHVPSDDVHYVNQQTMFMLSSTQHLTPTSKAGIKTKESLQLQHYHHQDFFPLTQASPEALAGNGMLTIGLMNVLVTLSAILRDNFRVYIPTVIYPLVQKTNDLHSDPVRNIAYSSLNCIATSSSYSSTEEMMVANYSYLMETLVAELRCGGSGTSPTYADLQSQAICFYSLHNVMAFIMHSVSESITVEDPSSTVENTILLIVDMQASMTDWFAKQFQKSSRSLLKCIMVPMGLVKVFQGSVDYLNEILLAVMDTGMMDSKGLNDVTTSEYFRWEDLLLEFQIDDGTSIDSNEASNKKFSASNEAEDNKDDNDAPNHPLSAHILQRLVVVLKWVLTTNSTILSLPDLKLQRLSCDLFASAFELFSTVQCHTSRCDKDDPILTDIGNPLSQSVSEYWPTLRIRFQSTTSSFIRASHDDQVGAKRHLASLLSSILRVVSTMGKLSGEMVANRFQDDIYPSMGKIFTHLLSEGHSSHASVIFSDTDEIILVSLLQTLKDIFSSKEGKMLLGNIVSSAGSMILPLLSQHTALGESAMDVMKLLLSIDCDCMWRSLLSLSHREFPPCPLHFGCSKPICRERVRTASQGDIEHPILRQRANALMDFIDCLPEQPLLHM